MEILNTVIIAVYPLATQNPEQTEQVAPGQPSEQPTAQSEHTSIATSTSAPTEKYAKVGKKDEIDVSKESPNGQKWKSINCQVGYQNGHVIDERRCVGRGKRRRQSGLIGREERLRRGV